jgi:hypothetical protein
MNRKTVVESVVSTILASVWAFLSVWVFRLVVLKVPAPASFSVTALVLMFFLQSVYYRFIKYVLNTSKDPDGCAHES